MASLKAEPAGKQAFEQQHGNSVHQPAEAVKNGEIKEGDPVALISAYWGAVQSVAETHAAHPEPPLPESRWIVDIVRK